MSDALRSDLDQIIDDIIDTLTFEERVRIANFDQADVEGLQEGLSRYLSSMIGDDPAEATDIIGELHRRLRDTHRLRTV